MEKKLEIEDSRNTGGLGESKTGQPQSILEVASHYSDECTIVGDGSEFSRAVC